MKVRRALQNSFMLSSDVSEHMIQCMQMHLRRKTHIFGRGICLNKYTGARGKSGSSDENASTLQKSAKYLTIMKSASRQQELR